MLENMMYLCGMTAEQFVDVIDQFHWETYACEWGPFVADYRHASLLLGRPISMPSDFPNDELDELMHNPLIYGVPKLRECHSISADDLNLARKRKAEKLAAHVKDVYYRDKSLIHSFAKELREESEKNNLTLHCAVQSEYDFLHFEGKLLFSYNSLDFFSPFDKTPSFILTPSCPICKDYYGVNRVVDLIELCISNPVFLILPSEVADEWLEHLLGARPELTPIEEIQENNQGVMIKMSYNAKLRRIDNLINDNSKDKATHCINFTYRGKSSKFEAKYCYSVLPSMYGQFSENACEFSHFETVPWAIFHTTGLLNAITVPLDGNWKPLAGPRYYQYYSKAHSGIIEDCEGRKVSEVLIMRSNNPVQPKEDYTIIIDAIKSIPKQKENFDKESLSYWMSHVNIATPNQSVLDSEIASSMLFQILEKRKQCGERLSNTQFSTLEEVQHLIYQESPDINVKYLAFLINEIEDMINTDLMTDTLNNAREIMRGMVSEVTKRPFNNKQCESILQNLLLISIDRLGLGQQLSKFKYQLRNPYEPRKTW